MYIPGFGGEASVPRGKWASDVNMEFNGDKERLGIYMARAAETMIENRPKIQ